MSTVLRREVLSTRLAYTLLRHECRVSGENLSASETFPVVACVVSGGKYMSDMRSTKGGYMHWGARIDDVEHE